MKALKNRNFPFGMGFASMTKPPPPTMNRKHLKTDESHEQDAVWKLLDHATHTSPGPRFVDDTVRAARLSGQMDVWWKRLFSPAPLAALAAATAALAFAAISLTGPDPGSAPAGLTTAYDTEQAAAIQEIAETETLIAAVDHLEDFSDYELVSLIGF